MTWRIAGIWMVVLALGLAIVGIIQAIQQSQSLAIRMMAQAEAEAGRIARDAGHEFEEDLMVAMYEAADFVRDHPYEAWSKPPDFPLWIDGVFAWTGRRLQIISPMTHSDAGWLVLIERRLALRGLQPNHNKERRVDLLHDSLDGVPAVIACLDARDSAGQSVLLAGRIDLGALRERLVEPKLAAARGLELVGIRAGAFPQPWSQQLFSALRHWAIQPTATFVREQERTVLGQAVVFLGLPILALATLLVAMWVLVRVVRRDVALAEMKANFVADVSHELKTPLALIRMFCETLQSGRVTSEDKRLEYYSIITRESTRLTNLIENILDFARIEAGRKEYRLERMDIAGVVHDTYEAYCAQLDHNDFEHHLTVEQGLPAVDADRDAIAQALINLITNAIKYSQNDRSLAIDVAADTRRGRHGVLISVHDRGIGIRPEDREHLFEGFFRAPDARVRDRGGTGLGLALVKHIVDAHGGSLDVESRLVKGSTFRIFLPASADRAEVHASGGAESDNPVAEPET